MLQLRPTSDRLLSVAGSFLAYRLSHDSSIEAVRVLERVSRQRSLIKVPIISKQLLK